MNNPYSVQYVTCQISQDTLSYVQAMLSPEEKEKHIREALLSGSFTPNQIRQLRGREPWTHAANG